MKEEFQWTSRPGSNGLKIQLKKQNNFSSHNLRGQPLPTSAQWLHLLFVSSLSIQKASPWTLSSA